VRRRHAPSDLPRRSRNGPPIGLPSRSRPTGDVAIVVARAVDVLLEKIEKERFGKTSRPRAARESADPAYISSATKRIVVAREGYRCAFIGETGERCTECRFLQFDHVIPRACGGTGAPSNVRLVCATHNRYLAERVFGRDHVQEQINQRRQRSASVVQAQLESSTQPATDGPPATSPASLDSAAALAGAPSASEQIRHALVSMGFRPGEAQRAVTAVEPEEGGSLVELLRRALAVLTPRTT